MKNKLQATIVHGWDNIMRARAAAVHAVTDLYNAEVLDLFSMKTDQVIIFSGAQTRWMDNPSEARDMYETFRKRMTILDKSGRIPGGVDFPEYTTGIKVWSVRIGENKVKIILEEDSVDAEDNAEKSIEIIKGLVENGNYQDLRITPLSSEFHVKRIQEAFERYIPQHLKNSIRAQSGEQALDEAWGRYAQYAGLKRKTITRKGKVLEVALRVASRTKVWRNFIRSKTSARVRKTPS